MNRRHGQLSAGAANLTPRSRAQLTGLLLFLLSATVFSGLKAEAGESRPPSAVKGITTRQSDAWLGPSAMAYLGGGKLLIACASAERVDMFDLAQSNTVRSFRMPANPSGLSVFKDRAYVTCAAAESVIAEMDLAKGAVVAEIRTGHTALGPVLSPDGKTLYVCLKFNDQISVLDTASHRELRRIQVGREPVSAALTSDGKTLLVAHHLPSGPANGVVVAASVGVVDVQAGAMVKELPLPTGSTLLREIRLSPDGRYAVVLHGLGHFQVPTTQLDRGWMNTAALTILDTAEPKALDTVVLDEVDRGAANPWASAWSNDGRQLYIAHAGTHEVSILNFPGLLEKLSAVHARPVAGAPSPAEDLSFLIGLRQRIKLSGNGPRSLVVGENRIYVAGFFSDTIDILEADRPSKRQLTELQPQPSSTASVLRLGEKLFNDATICFQSWQSCASCHSEDGRVDGLNWDLLNDGLGNPKNTKSLLLAHRTPPSMSTGVRISAEEAVRAGLRHILFAAPSEEVAMPIDEWLKSLNPMASPHFVAGKLSPAAKRGQKLFNSSQTGCSSCHKPALFTDLQSYDVGTADPLDHDVHDFDTPTLIELWRTAPYLHDGSAATLREVLTTRNNADQHGKTSRLSSSEVDDLIEYLLSL